MDKKLQVFVSSTYDDMKPERQAAVETILKARHIPAGMELFVAGDRSQLDVIKQWIEDSDVFMLILGGRYGSIEPDSGKSYIEVEYEFAASLNKPLFAVVMHEVYLNEKVGELKGKAIEQDHPDLLKDFKGRVLKKMCSSFKNIGELKLAVLESVLEIQRTREAELVGWVRANNVTDPAPLAAQIGQLQQEILILREKAAAKAEIQSLTETYAGYEFIELCKWLHEHKIDPPPAYQKAAVAEFGTHVGIPLLQLLWTYRKRFCAGIGSSSSDQWHNWSALAFVQEFSLYGFVERIPNGVRASPGCISFLNRLQREEQLRTGELALQGD